jgi:Protein of unknown function (DUF2851)
MQFSEKLMYHIWDAQHLQKKIKTISSKSIKVLFSGRWNTYSGPDFKDAIIEIDGKVKRGDVELEIDSYNWHLHEHDENPAFNSVILHVVYNHNGKYENTISENGTQIEILEISNNLDSDIAKLLLKYSDKTYEESNRECALFADNDFTFLQSIFTKLGKDRFESKVNRFKAEHYFAEFDQMLWQGLLEALGYSKNKFQMIQLALHLKINKLKEINHEKKLSEDELIALLLGTADLLHNLPSVIPTETKLKWQILFSEQMCDLQPIKLEWKLFRIRPVNHPALRIIQISKIIHNSLETSLFHDILKLFSSSAKNFSIVSFRKKLYDFFQDTSDNLPENLKLGKTRIDTILINILLPIIMVYACEKRFELLADTIDQIYQNYPRLPSNYISKHMERFMSVEQVKIFRKKALYQQAILKLYYSNCQYHACNDCTDVMKQYNNEKDS